MSGKVEAYRFLSCQLACRPLRKLHLPASKRLNYKDCWLAVAFCWSVLVIALQSVGHLCLPCDHCQASEHVSWVGLCRAEPLSTQS